MDIIQHQEVGELKVGKEYNFIFHIPKSIPINNVHLSTSCGCTDARYVDTPTERYVTVKYTPAKIPQHLVKQGFYTVTKFVTVLMHMSTGASELIKLSFNGTVKS